MDDLLHLILFGGLQTRKGSGPAAVLPTWKARALLAYLAVRADQPHSRNQLAALLWGGVSEPKARKALRQALFWIRKALVRGGLHVDAQTVTLSASAVHLDVALFERSAGTGAPADLERAVGLYRGDLLEGLTLQEPPFEEWLLAKRERLREIALESLAKLVAHQQARGEDEAALQHARQLLALDPSFDLSQAGDFGLLLPGCIAALAAAYARGGRFTSEAQALLRTATEREASSPIRIKQSQRLAWIAEALAVAHRVPEAISLGEGALALARTQGERAVAAEALKVLADLARQQHPPDLERAEGRYRDTLALALSLGMRPLAADCHLALAEIVRVGDPGAAEEHLASATTMSQEMDVHLPLGVLQ